MKRTALALVLTVSLAACSGGQTALPPPTVVNPLQSVLQVAVGTANIFGTVHGLNVEVTMRQPAGGQTPGDSGTLVNTPSLQGPFTLSPIAQPPDQFGASIELGPTQAEAGGHTLTGTLQQNPGTPSNDIPPSTFGVSTGAFGLGLEPYNASVTGSPSSPGFGQPDSFDPYTQPLYDAAQISASGGADPNAFVPWGGPPAFDPNHDGKGTRDNSGFPAGLLGTSEGLDVFSGIAPVGGKYTLSLTIPTSPKTTGTESTSAQLTSLAQLPAVQAPAPALDGKGGGSFAVTLPAGVTEAYVQIADIGPAVVSSGVQPANCNSATDGFGDLTPVYYTLVVHASGSASLPDGDGPGNPGTTTPSICTAAQNQAVPSSPSGVGPDQITVQLIGFDYPAYEASYPASLGKPAPKLTGPNGQADITISPLAFFGPSSGNARVRFSGRQR